MEESDDKRRRLAEARQLLEAEGHVIKRARIYYTNCTFQSEVEVREQFLAIWEYLEKETGLLQKHAFTQALQLWIEKHRDILRKLNRQ